MLTEPAITNNIGLLLPDDGFHHELRRLTRETGTLLAIDETHTQVFGPGGLTAEWGLEPDLLVAGKSIAGGLPFGAWGMTEPIAELLEQRKGPDGERSNLVATGGTIFGNPLAMAAARAVLTEILVPDAYAHTQRLGAQARRGMRASVERHGLPWHIPHLGPRAGYLFQPDADPRRGRGPGGGRRAADAADPRMARQPRRVGGDRRRRARVLGPVPGRRRRRLSRRLGLAAGRAGRLSCRLPRGLNRFRG